MIEVGAAKKDISPSLTVPHAGWGSQSHIFADGVEAKLYVRALVITGRRSSSVIIDVDAMALRLDLTNDIRQAVSAAVGIPVPHIRVAFSHSHASPAIWSDYYLEGKEAVANYKQMLIDQSVSAAVEAKKDAVKVYAGAGWGSCDIGVNRRQLVNGRQVVGANPAGVTDPAVGVIRFEDETGRTRASIVQYACHPTTLGYTYRLHSPDYPGVTRQFVEDNVGGICIFLQGSGGDIGPGPEGFLDNEAAMKRIGTALGASAVQTLMEIEAATFAHQFQEVIESGAPLAIWKSVKTKSDDELEVISATISVPLKKLVPLEQATATYNDYKQQLEQLQHEGASDSAIKDVTTKLKRAYITLTRSETYEGKTMAEIETQFIKIGDIVLIGAQLEPFVQIGLRIKEQSPFPYTLFGGYSNGVLGYFPTAEACEEGGYEIDASPFAPEAADYFVREVGHILNNLAKDRGEKP